MSDAVSACLMVPLYLFEGYCLRLLYRAFLPPKLGQRPGADWAVCCVWTAIRFGCFWLLPGDGSSRVLLAKLFLYAALLWLFSFGWYRGTVLLKSFLVTLFLSVYVLSFLAAYSLIYIGHWLVDLLTHFFERGALTPEVFLQLVQASVVFAVFAVEVAQAVLLFITLRNIVRKYCREKRRLIKKEIFYYTLPATAGILVAVLMRFLFVTVEKDGQVLLYETHPALYIVVPLLALVLLAAIVFSFHLYQNLLSLHEERSEKLLLEHQVMQLQNSILEMERLYDGIRSIKHDMKNHMATLQHLLWQNGWLKSDATEIAHYFADMEQAVHQLDDQIHTGNPVTDVVINSKFKCAQEKVKNIRLDADEFIFTAAASFKPYDLGILLNNALDNAIEANFRLRQKRPDAAAYISVRSFWKGRMYFIEIKNSCDGTLSIDEQTGYPASAKPERELHGFGLRNIKSCALKYAGDLDISVEGETFLLSVMLQDSEKTKRKGEENS